MGKYYAVRKGKNPGIYTKWSECSSNIIGFKGAEYKSFKTMEEAEEYMSRETKSYDDIDLSCLEAYANCDEYSDDDMFDPEDLLEDDDTI